MRNAVCIFCRIYNLFCVNLNELFQISLVFFFNIVAVLLVFQQKTLPHMIIATLTYYISRICMVIFVYILYKYSNKTQQRN